MKRRRDTRVKPRLDGRFVGDLRLRRITPRLLEPAGQAAFCSGLSVPIDALGSGVGYR